MAKDPRHILSQFDTDAFPPIKGPAVYAVFVCNPSWECGAEHLLYIGSSRDVERRRNMISHPYRVAYDRFHGKVVYTKQYYCEDFRDVEKLLIRFFKPVMNISIPKLDGE